MRTFFSAENLLQPVFPASLRWGNEYATYQGCSAGVASTRVEATPAQGRVFIPPSEGCREIRPKYIFRLDEMHNLELYTSKYPPKID